jgi:uncharacterized protein YdeI (BOF family)
MKGSQRLTMLLTRGGILASTILGGTQLQTVSAQASPVSQPIVNLRSEIRNLAQVQAPPSQPTRTQIGDLRRTTGLTISGRVVSVVGNDFTLDDGTGRIIVDSGPRWYREIALNPGEQVTVTGQLSEKSEEFDAFSIQRADGSLIEIRPAQGPPPWAGGPRGKELRR